MEGIANKQSELKNKRLKLTSEKTTPKAEECCELTHNNNTQKTTQEKRKESKNKTKAKSSSQNPSRY
jgi:hypothetical protein